MLCSFTSHTAHSTRSRDRISSDLVLVLLLPFPSLPQRLELVLQPAVFASQGQRIVGTVAETTETPPAQFPVPTLHRSLNPLIGRAIISLVVCGEGVKSFPSSRWPQREARAVEGFRQSCDECDYCAEWSLVWRRFSDTGKHGQTGLPGREITLSRLLPYVTMIQLITLPASCFMLQSAQKIGP
ncbi:hypothetical protein BGZ57DRAFT_852741 [Hyaloscypha finlandica]|nr:hypothetical protein BGZ57DRAFT_852741 [Hyaloscypha finlandica]